MQIFRPRVLETMTTKASILVISATILLVLATTGQATHQYPKVGNNFTSQVRMEHCELLSKWDVLVLPRNLRESDPAILSTLRSLNPDIEILTYFPCAAVWVAHDTMDTAAHIFGEKVESNDWFLYDNKGNRVGDPSDCWLVNLSCKCPPDEHGMTIQEWLADHIATQVLLGGPWDGVLLDRLFDDPWWINNFDWFQEPPAMLDIDRDGFADGPDSALVWWRTGVISFLDNLKREVGQSYILVGNGKHCLSDYLNGGIREDFPHMHGGWEENMLSSYGYLTLCRKMLDDPMSCTMMLCWWRNEENTLFEPKRTATYERFLRYTLCSALLGDGYYFLYGGSRNLWWEDYYDLDLGTPTSEAYRDSVWNLMYSRYSMVWRRDFENATVYCNPYQEYVSFDAGWLSPEDGLIKMHTVPSSVDITILPGSLSASSFDRTDPNITYKVAITNNSENAVFASVWATLSRGGATFVSGSQVEYLVGVEDTAVKDRVLRLPPTLSPGKYCLKVMVGGPGFAEVASDTVMLTKVIDFDKHPYKHDTEGGGSVSVSPQPVTQSSRYLNVQVEPGGSSGHLCSVMLYDVNGRLVNRAFDQKIGSALSLDIDLAGGDGMRLAPGVYFLSVDLEDHAFTKKIVVLAR
jgi:hypothetical protein